MYENIGEKIKFVAKAIFALGSIGTFILGIVLMAADTSVAKGSKLDTIYLTVGILLVILGPVFSWLASVPIYGFGELIDKATAIEHNTRGGAPINQATTTEQNTRSNEITTVAQHNENAERIRRIEKLRSQGLITEEEYNQTISKMQ